jgi:apolipoprotein N-acyltransferase
MSSSRWPERAAALGAGALCAASLPPWGWWPLAYGGLAILDRLVAQSSQRRQRFSIGLMFSIGWLAPGMGWMWFLTAPGYVAVTLLFAAAHGLGLMAVPADRRRWVALPAAIMVVELGRWTMLFGGVPLAMLPHGQVSSPLARLLPLGGSMAVTAATVMVGGALSALGQRAWRWAGAMITALLLALFASSWASTGATAGFIKVSIVQGGGPQGTRAVDGGLEEERRVFQRHLDATALVPDDTELVVWPENVVNVTGTFSGSDFERQLLALSKQHSWLLSVGIVEDVIGQPDRFYNAQVLIDNGEVVGRYDKVRRVPFGEFIPGRSLLESLGAPVSAVPKDAIAGTGPAVIESRLGRLGVVISWEVFFGGRGRDAAIHDGVVTLNPTNGSSFTGTVLQSQQVASSRIRAREADRAIVQAAPTGFSAFVAADGTVQQRSAISQQWVATQDVEMRTGTTWYVRMGDRPLVIVGLLVVIGCWWPELRRRTRLGAARRFALGGNDNHDAMATETSL